MRKFFIGFGIGVALLATALGAGVHRQKTLREHGPESSGVVEATRVALTARVSGRIITMNADEGHQVRKGDLLAEIDCAELEAQHSAAEARTRATAAELDALRSQVSAARFQLEASHESVASQQASIDALRAQERLAERESARARALFKDRVMNESALDSSVTALEDLKNRVAGAAKAARAASLAAQASREQVAAMSSQMASLREQVEGSKAEGKRIEILLGECRVTAPIDGVVAEKVREPGESVAPGTLVYELREVRVRRVKFFIHNSSLGDVAVGDLVRVVPDTMSEKSFSARITRIAEEASFTPRSVQTRDDRDRLVYAAEAEIETAGNVLRPGMPVEVFLMRR